MGSRIGDLRDALAADLAVVGVPVMTDWEVQAEPPCIQLRPPAGPYVHGGDQFASYVLHLDVAVLVEAKPGNASRDQLETLIEDVLRNCVDWALDGVDPPAATLVTESTVDFLGTIVHLSKSLYL